MTFFSSTSWENIGGDEHRAKSIMSESLLGST